MSNRTTVINTALQRLGAQGGNLAFSGTPGEQLAEAAYGAALEYCLALYDWPFAVRLACLAREATPPAFGYRYAYTLPGDCLRILDLREHHNGKLSASAWQCPSPPFRIVGRSIHSDAPALALRYVSSNRDMIFEPLFADALAWRLAFALVAYLPQGAVNASNFLQMFEAALDRAKLEADVQQNPVQELWASLLLAERQS